MTMRTINVKQAVMSSNSCKKGSCSTQQRAENPDARKLLHFALLPVFGVWGAEER